MDHVVREKVVKNLETTQKLADRSLDLADLYEQQSFPRGRSAELFSDAECVSHADLPS